MFKEYKDMVDPCTVENIPEFSNVKCVGKSFLHKKNPFSYDEDVLKLESGATIPFLDGEHWRAIANKGDLDFTPALSLDIGDALEYGKDYYVYLCIDGNSPEIVVSQNSTVPNGSTPLTSIKIGGFHNGALRRVSDDGRWVPIDSTGVKFGTNGTPWKDNVTKGIVPNSVWDLKHRPKVVVPGMAEVNGVWLAIYQASLEENVSFKGGAANLVHATDGKIVSKYGKLPATGTEGLCQYNFNELAQMQGLRLPSYAEWLKGAYGVPQCEDGNDRYGWAKKSNTARTYTGCSVNTITGAYEPTGGTKPFSVSAYNLCDCGGNVWEWLDDYSIYPSGNWDYYSVLGAEMGKASLYGSSGLHALIAGGDWDHGSRCGARAVNTNGAPWVVSVYIGARFACDAA